MVEHPASAVSVQRLLQQLERELHQGGPGALAFDADGTLWEGDVSDDVLRYACRVECLQPEVAPAVAAFAAHHGLSSTGNVHELALRVLHAFEAGAVPRLPTFQLMTWIYAGLGASELAELTDAALRGPPELERRHRPALRQVLQWARQHELRCVVVSASPQFIVERGVQALGFEPRDVHGTRLHFERGLAQQRLPGFVPFGEDKVRACRQLLGDVRPLAAFGDSLFDLELLRYARLAVAVYPEPALTQQLQGLEGAYRLGAEAPAP